MQAHQTGTLWRTGRKFTTGFDPEHERVDSLWEENYSRHMARQTCRYEVTVARTPRQLNRGRGELSEVCHRGAALRLDN